MTKMTRIWPRSRRMGFRSVFMEILIRLKDSNVWVPNMLTTGVTGANGAWTRTRIQSPARHSLSGMTVSVMSTQTMSVDGAMVRFGTRARWTLITSAAWVLLPQIAGQGGAGVVRMDGRDAGDLASGLGRRIHHVDAASQVEDAHQEDEERDQDEAELDEGLARGPVATTMSSKHGEHLSSAGSGGR